MSPSPRASANTVPSGVPFWRSSFALALALLVATLCAYRPVFDAAYIWDDDWYLTANPYLKDLAGLARLWVPESRPQYYPAVFTTFWIEHQLWGLEPFGYHLVNVLLHALNAILVWRVARALGMPGAWWIGAVFALHPVHVESVAWVTERKNVLSGCFYLCAFLAYLRFDPFGVDATPPRERTRWRWYAVALLCFVFALLAKTVTCSLPAVLILAMFWRRAPFTRSRLAALAPFFVVGLVLALHTAHLERNHVGAEGAEFAFSALDRLWIASKALLFYPQKLLVPFPLVFIYPRWTLPAGDALAYWPIAVVAVLAAVAVVAFWRGHRGPALALAFFAGTLFPALGFFNVYPMRYSFVADHFQYLASLGLVALVVAALALHAPRALANGVGVCALVVFGALTWRQCANYADEETLWRATAARNPGAWMVHTNLAKLLSARGDNEEALACLERALATQPSAKATEQVRLNIALTLGKLKRFPEALALFEELQQSSGGMESRIALTLEHLRRDDEAEAYYRRALAGEAADEARVPFGLHLLRRDRPAEAVTVLEPFVAAHPAEFDVTMFLADAYALTGRIDDARRSARSALAEARARNDLRAVKRIEKRLAQWPETQ